ncbi:MULTISPECIES: hypothetical protein [unclassified Coleofasciculus]|uniref:hypothetical protein n=1 Tax=unclassified Coleofasciculus TaxID=2692782 RepID=UPI00187E693B|nr:MULTISPECIES: hypothetical protein [unclassified Coleofasciculus]MBE9129925.1 hypothetical protein [Coleofasciculus sp. LEGE 07081]MBE9151458.1 hypothetical protein [Coleofasciculus sp. LEGE 07092]
MSKELKITMLGASGVGKTTLLTSMYEQFEATSSQANLQLKPDIETAATLERYLAQLKTLTYEFKAEERNKGIRGTLATAGPESLPSYIFDLGHNDQKQFLRLLFRDYPGGYILHNDIAGRRFVQKLLRECAAVIVAIDTPALMELNGRWHEVRNKPGEILKLFKTAYQTLDEPKLVIFAPVKCETYVQDEASANKLIKCIQERYAPVLEFFQEPIRADKIAVVTAPVQTVGCVVFLKVEVENLNQPRFYFRKISFDAKYSPKDSEQLLRYLLRFLLKMYIQDRSWPLFNPVRQFFKPDAELKQAVEQFAKGCKTRGGFAVLQGQRLLSI